MRRPHADPDLDFLSMALDGYQQRLDTMQATLDALRATIERRSHAPAHAPAATDRPARKKAVWTQAMRDAQAKRLRDRWKAGDFDARRKPKKKAAG
jgi:hypothetical protein